MTDRKREKPLELDMSFEEALKRFAGVDPEELPDSIKLRKRRRRKNGDGESPPSKVDRKSRDPDR